MAALVRRRIAGRIPSGAFQQRAHSSPPASGQPVVADWVGLLVAAVPPSRLGRASKAGLERSVPATAVVAVL